MRLASLVNPTAVQANAPMDFEIFPLLKYKSPDSVAVVPVAIQVMHIDCLYTPSAVGVYIVPYPWLAVTATLLSRKTVTGPLAAKLALPDPSITALKTDTELGAKDGAGAIPTGTTAVGHANV